MLSLYQVSLAEVRILVAGLPNESTTSLTNCPRSIIEESAQRKPGVRNQVDLTGSILLLSKRQLSTNCQVRSEGPTFLVTKRGLPLNWPKSFCSTRTALNSPL